jgi:hypothetical protein
MTAKAMGALVAGGIVPAGVLSIDALFKSEYVPAVLP